MSRNRKGVIDTFKLKEFKDNQTSYGFKGHKGSKYFEFNFF